MPKEAASHVCGPAESERRCRGRLQGANASLLEHLRSNVSRLMITLHTPRKWHPV